MADLIEQQDGCLDNRRVPDDLNGLSEVGAAQIAASSRALALSSQPLLAHYSCSIAVLPEFAPEEKDSSDWNDVIALRGLDDARVQSATTPVAR
jgi:hypothetical protein